MPKEILEQLFDSPVKVRLLKLFLRNPNQSFGIRDIVKRIKTDLSSCQRQIKKLESIKFVNSKIKSGRKIYSANRDFDFYNELSTLVLKSSPASKEKILGRLRSLGRIKLAILSGIFVNLDNSRVDLLVVGDAIRKKKLANFFRDLEAEAGKEIDYVVLSTRDFKYRYDMFDRFIRDVLEKPHEKLVNKLKV
jgi:predicted nucleotidyltransferase